MSPAATIAIVGGGVSGTLTAVQLLRSGAAVRVVMINRDGGLARGVAYSTTSPAHLLNVPAARMSALPDDAEHFLRWARMRLGPSTPADAFLPRALYGEYVAQLFNETRFRAPRGTIDCVCARAVDVDPAAAPRVRLDNGDVVSAARVVIARGHSLPRNPPVVAGEEFYGSARYVRNAWSAAALQAVDPDADVLLIGTALTMYDVVLALRERGHRATIHAVSRRGLTPRCHAPRPLAVRGGPASESWLRIAPTARTLARALRSACDAAAAEHGDWRAVIDSIRPVAAQLWQRLAPRERARFVTRLRPFWEVHRHRAPIEVHRQIGWLVADGVLHLYAGQVRSWRHDAAGVMADLGERSLRVGHVINCTGPDGDVLRSEDPLVRSLLARGLIVRDPLGIGIETAEDGAIIDRRGHPSSWLFTLGTWRKPRLWESVAVPELRVQAADLARRLTHDLRDVAEHRDAEVPRPESSAADRFFWARP